MSLDAITAEISAGRPLAVDITWNSGAGSHVVAIAGAQRPVADLRPGKR
jgi:hypothetical protein